MAALTSLGLYPAPSVPLATLVVRTCSLEQSSETPVALGAVEWGGRDGGARRAGGQSPASVMGDGALSSRAHCPEAQQPPCPAPRCPRSPSTERVGGTLEVVNGVSTGVSRPPSPRRVIRCGCPRGRVYRGASLLECQNVFLVAPRLEKAITSQGVPLCSSHSAATLIRTANKQKVEKLKS